MTFALVATVDAQSSLADRIKAGDRRAALAMIAQGADVNQTQPDGSTPLHWAVYGSVHGWHPERGDYGRVVELLLEAGATAPAIRSDFEPSEAVRDVLKRHRVSS